MSSGLTAPEGAGAKTVGEVADMVVAAWAGPPVSPANITLQGMRAARATQRKFLSVMESDLSAEGGAAPSDG